MIFSMWRHRNRRTNRGQPRRVAAWTALDTLPSTRDGAGIWPPHQPNLRAGGQ